MKNYLLIIIIFVWFGSQNAQEMPIPIDVQYKLFSKILTYERNLKEDNDEILIGIIYQDLFRTSLLTKNEFIENFNKSAQKSIDNIPIHCKTISLNSEKELIETLESSEIDILYVTPLRSFNLKTIVQESRKNKILTMSGVPEYIEAGLSVGIGISGNNPQILINLPASKAEGANFSSKLLKIAKIIK